MSATTYMLGYDCGKSGPDEINCHYSLFATPELAAEWERGKADAEAGREPNITDKDGE